ncbi:MAG TPA: helix-turn-helix domain-containing protein [Firmicutes bacterium]|nr:helix-turn-helix domain-containing protein [Bacillota bacterium]
MGNLGALIEESGLARLARSFCEATGLRAVVIDAHGAPVLSPHDWENCALCHLVRSSEEGRERCDSCYAKAGEQAAQLGDLYIFRCHAGLVNWAAPIMIGSDLLGSVVCGQVVMWDLDEIFINEVIQRTKDLGCDPGQVRDALKEIEMLSAKKVQAAAELLYAVTTSVVQSADLVQKQRREIAMQQARLGEEIQARKRLEFQLMTQKGGAFFSRQKEQELIRHVRAGDRTQAKSILNYLLADIFLYGSTRIEIIKARLLELSVMLSRAAVEAGASLDRVLGLNYQHVCELSLIDDFGDLCHWIVQLLDKFMDSVYEVGHASNSGPVMKAIQYMKENLSSRLTIEDVAGAVNISPSYLSHLFKEEMGCSIMDYLTQLRLEEAKRLLLDPCFNVASVSEMVGYSDPANFSKAFKKAEGITPSIYKRRAIG